MNKEIKQFIKWLEEEDRQNWEIERYVEVMLEDERQRMIEEIEKMKKIYREPEFGPDGPDDGAIEAMISQRTTRYN